MRSRRIFSITLAFALVVAAYATALAQRPAARDFDKEAETALRAAKDAAGFEYLGTFGRLCILPPTNGAPDTSNNVPNYVADPKTVPARNTWYAEPVQIFDDLYWLGGKVHSAWLITDPDGYILIDTQYPYNSEELVIGGMRRLGLDPARIKYFLISHAHGDHIGGVEIVAKAAPNAIPVMGKADWETVARFPNRYKTMMPNAGKSISVSTPMDIEVGTHVVHVYPTPGHTPGTLSFTFPVSDHGRRVMVAYAGGTAFGFQTDKPDPGITNLQQYISSNQMMADIAVKTGVTVLISNHSEFDMAEKKAKMMAGRGFGPHPFELGAEWVQRYFQVMVNCSKVKIISLEKERARSTNP